jgi:hypothetical protein
MALTPLRWVAIAVAAMLGFIVLSWGRVRAEYKPTAEEHLEDVLQRKASLHSSRVQRFARQVRMAQLSDSLRGALPRGTEGVRAFYGRDVDQAIRSALDTALQRAREKTGAAPRIGVDVVTINDTLTISGVRPWWSYHAPFYILPSRATDRCIVVLPAGKGLSPWALARTLNSEDARMQILGPCAFYAAFGLPGDSIRDWLRSRGVLLALGGSWTQNAGALQTSGGEPFYTSSTSYYPGPPNAFYFMSGRAVNCVVGNRSACESIIMDRASTPIPLAVGSVVRPGVGIGPMNHGTGNDFRGREFEIVSDMVRSLGRERFERFWRSNDAVPTAFQKASGMSLGEWVSSWGRERIDRIEHGPVPRALSVLSAIGIVVVCMLWVVFASRRRVYA